MLPNGGCEERSTSTIHVWERFGLVGGGCVCVCVFWLGLGSSYTVREEGQSLIAAWEGKDGGTAILAYRKGKQKKVRHSWSEDICASIYLSVSPLTGALMCVFLTVNKEGDAKRTGVDMLSPKIHNGVQKGRPSTCCLNSHCERKASTYNARAYHAGHEGTREKAASWCLIALCVLCVCGAC